MTIIQPIGTEKLDSGTTAEGVPTSAPAQELTPSPAKDLAICAAIFCGASVAWFGWGQAGGRLGGILEVGCVLAVLATIAAAIGIARTPGTPSMSVDPGVRRTYWLSVAAEVACIAAGAVILSRLDGQEFMPVWTLAVVGLHFIPLSRAFRLPSLIPAAIGCVIAALGAVAAEFTGVLPAQTVAGLAGGAVLLVSGVVSMRMARR